MQYAFVCVDFIINLMIVYIYVVSDASLIKCSLIHVSYFSIGHQSN